MRRASECGARPRRRYERQGMFRSCGLSAEQRRSLARRLLYLKLAAEMTDSGGAGREEACLKHGGGRAEDRRTGTRRSPQFPAMLFSIPLSRDPFPSLPTQARGTPRAASPHCPRPAPPTRRGFFLRADDRNRDGERATRSLTIAALTHDRSISRAHPSRWSASNLFSANRRSR